MLMRFRLSLRFVCLENTWVSFVLKVHCTHVVRYKKEICEDPHGTVPLYCCLFCVKFGLLVFRRAWFFDSFFSKVLRSKRTADDRSYQFLFIFFSSRRDNCSRKKSWLQTPLPIGIHYGSTFSVHYSKICWGPNSVGFLVFTACNTGHAIWLNINPTMMEIIDR